MHVKILSGTYLGLQCLVVDVQFEPYLGLQRLVVDVQFEPYLMKTHLAVFGQT
jgi:hypothetical protein